MKSLSRLMSTGHTRYDEALKQKYITRLGKFESTDYSSNSLMDQYNIRSGFVQLVKSRFLHLAPCHGITLTPREHRGLPGNSRPGLVATCGLPRRLPCYDILTLSLGLCTELANP